MRNGHVRLELLKFIRALMGDEFVGSVPAFTINPVRCAGNPTTRVPIIVFNRVTYFITFHGRNKRILGFHRGMG